MPIPDPVHKGPCKNPELGRRIYEISHSDKKKSYSNSNNASYKNNKEKDEKKEIKRDKIKYK